MARWRFYQGLKREWRWYELDKVGRVTTASNRAFDELTECMANAESVGFDGRGYQVLTRAPWATVSSARLQTPD